MKNAPLYFIFASVSLLNLSGGVYYCSRSVQHSKPHSSRQLEHTAFYPHHGMCVHAMHSIA
jgi:hypothetical protein